MAPGRAAPKAGSPISIALKAVSVLAFAAASPLLILVLRAMRALPMAIRWVISAAPSPEIMAIGTPALSVTSAVTLLPSARQVAIATCAASTAKALVVPRARGGRGAEASAAVGLGRIVWAKACPAINKQAALTNRPRFLMARAFIKRLLEIIVTVGFPQSITFVELAKRHNRSCPAPAAGHRGKSGHCGIRSKRLFHIGKAAELS